MTVIMDSVTGGLRRSITLDGIDLGLMPPSMPITPEPLQDIVNTLDGGSVAFGVYAGLGHADMLDRYTIPLDYEHVDGTLLRTLQRQRAIGGFHTLCVWKPIFTFYTARAAQSRFLLPRYRRNAGKVHEGLIFEGVTVNTTSAPFKAWKIVGGVATALTIVYANGPTVTTPAAGSLTVARDAHFEGIDTGYAEFRIGDVLAAGDKIELEWFPVFTGMIVSPRQEYPKTIAESISFTFQER